MSEKKENFKKHKDFLRKRNIEIPKDEDDLKNLVYEIEMKERFGDNQNEVFMNYVNNN